MPSPSVQGWGLQLASGCPVRTVPKVPASHSTARTVKGRCWTERAPNAAASLGWSVVRPTECGTRDPMLQ
eukprot:286823-Pleurochrysis_carterae.AAC.1